jgi:hypothetical protein
MGRYCHPEGDGDPDCRICKQYAADAAFRAAIDAIPRKHDGRPESPAITTPQQAEFRIPLNCFQEGKIVSECDCGNDDLHVRGCRLYGHSVRKSGRPVAARLCATCQDHHWQLFPGYPNPLPTHTRPTDSKAHIAAFQKMLANTPKYLGDDGRRGIIWTCHSPRFWPMLVAHIRVLRKLGCTLPVEVWWRGSAGQFDRRYVDGLNVEFHDRDEYASRLRNSRIPCGIPDKEAWENKTYAAVHTWLRYAWVLDSDALFVRNPQAIVPDCPFGYWIDLDGWEFSTNWVNFGLPQSSQMIPQVQGGHLWFDRQKSWRLLTLVHWMNQHLDYFYQGSDNDQSCFRAGLAAKTCPNYRIFDDLSKPGGWVQKAHVCRYEGEPLITHYCRGKLEMPELHVCDQVPGDRERREEFARVVLESQ